VTTRAYWEQDHSRRRGDPALYRPTTFAYEALDVLPPGATLLDLGCGNGHDSALFAQAGLRVTALDVAAAALDAFLPIRSGPPVDRIRHCITDIPYPLEDRQFDAVYARLSLHYFDAATTARALGELHRVLRPGGLLLALVNSVDDPEYGTGTQVEESFFELAPGVRKRFFSRASLLAAATTARFSPQSATTQGTFVALRATRPA
jgi:SAM-dependent methyltransferase